MNDMNELRAKINTIIVENKLVGIYDFSDDEYSMMLEYVGQLCASNHGLILEDYNIIFTTLVEITKRWKESEPNDDCEENSRFWSFVFRTLTGDELFDSKLYDYFKNIISKMGACNNLAIVKTGKKYYATLMMHAFAPRDSINSFFDLCYNIFKKDLDYGFTSSDEWLCDIVYEQLKEVLGGNYREDKLVSIGSSAYSIKIGLRSFVLNDTLSEYFIDFIKNTFYNINKHFNNENIELDSRIARCLSEWWQTKNESKKADGIVSRRISTVTKQDIKAKYILRDDKVILSIPSIRIENEKDHLRLLIWVNDNIVYSAVMETKRGEIVIATKPIEFNLAELLKCYNQNRFTIRMQIEENGSVLFDSEKSKTTSLNREFLLFDGEKEIFSQINTLSNYFVFARDIDALKSTPKELTTSGDFLYNIYPTDGETLIGEEKQILFVKSDKTANAETNVCLIGSLSNVEWICDNHCCMVYKNVVKLLVPESSNLRALELRVDNTIYKLYELEYERIELGCFQFGLKTLGIILNNKPIKISIYSYEQEYIIFEESIIVLPNLEIQFNRPYYYGDSEKKLTISYNNQTNEISSWNNLENELFYKLDYGTLIIKIPYMKWRIDDGEWKKAPLNKKVWYKNVVNIDSLLEVETPIEKNQISIIGVTDGRHFDVHKSKSGKFEIGRMIYLQNDASDIKIFCADNIGGQRAVLNTATKEHLYVNPVTYHNGMVYWNIESSFIGDNHNDFFLILKPNGKNDKKCRFKVSTSNKELGVFDEDIYSVIVKLRNRSIFSKDNEYAVIYEDKLIIGKPEKFRFRNSALHITGVSAALPITKNTAWKNLNDFYLIKDLKYVEEFVNDCIYEYYIGNLCVFKNDTIKYLNMLNNEKSEKEQINPVRIELRDNRSFWLNAGYDIDSGDIELGSLIYDNLLRRICNINSKDTTRYMAINLYQFEEIQ